MSQTLYVMIEDIFDVSDNSRCKAITLTIDEITGSASVYGFYKFLPEIVDTNDIIEHLKDMYPSPDYILKPWCYSDHPGATPITEHSSYFTIESDLLTLAELCDIVRMNRRLDAEKVEREYQKYLNKKENRLTVRQAIEKLSQLTETQKDMFLCFETPESDMFVTKIVPEYSDPHQIGIVLIKGDI